MPSRSTRSRPVFCVSRRITTDSPYCVGIVEMRMSIALPRMSTWKRPSCGKRFSEMSRPDISFRRNTSAGRDLRIGLGLQVQHAVDAETHMQVALLRLDVDVGGAHLGGVFEQVCSSLTTGASFSAASELIWVPKSASVCASSAVSSRDNALISPVRRYSRSMFSISCDSATTAIVSSRLSSRLSSSNANRSVGSARPTRNAPPLTPLSSSTIARKRRACASESVCTSVAFSENCFRLM